MKSKPHNQYDFKRKKLKQKQPTIVIQNSLTIIPKKKKK